jgi:hypothetical protein
MGLDRVRTRRARQGFALPKTAVAGYVNRQKVVRKTDRPGNDHSQFSYEMECTRTECRGRHDSPQLSYGANGSDLHLRLCPAACQGGTAGLEV